MTQYLTKEGLQRMKDELKEIKTVKIPENIKLIKYAAAEGDLKENAEYHAAKEKPTTQDYFVSLSKVSGTPTRVAINLYGKKFVDSPYIAIGTYIPWTLTSTDTTIVISNATVNRYSYFKVLFTPAGTGVSKINLQRFKIYLE